MKDLTKASRRISRILRHDPGSAGLALDSAGWTDAASLAMAVGVTMDELREIVAENNKNRFELLDGRIRARQGHSVEVDLGLVEETPPRTLYHGTVESAVESIMRDGLLRMKRHHVHLSADRQTAEVVASRRKSNSRILEINAAAMRADGHKFYKSGNGVWLTDSVPPKYIR